MNALWTNKPIAICLSILLLTTLSVQGEDASTESQEILETLYRLQPDSVLQMVDRSVHLDAPLKTLFRAWAYHQKGMYKKVVSLLEPLSEDQLPPVPMLRSRFREIKAGDTLLQDFKIIETEHFSIRFQEGRDQVMVFFLPDVLEQFHEYYSKLFNFNQKERIIVEIMPHHELFSYACALTKQQIETTGTVALCVENRLAFITPRRVLTGYDWAHVISHEFVHYILTKQSHNHAPLWFQEGVAKFMERRWDDPNPEALDKTLAHSLATGFKENRLVSLDEMHPSFAALPTPELAHRAYAQVASMVDYLAQQKGLEIIPQWSVKLATTPKLEDLFTQDLGKNFDTFQVDWQDWAKKQDYKILEGQEFHKVKLLEEDAGQETLKSAKKLEETQDENERKFRRIGDVLLEGNHWQAALVEYHKLQKIRIANGKKVMDRQLLLRFLTCYRSLNQFKGVTRLIDSELDSLESDSTMLQIKAESLWKQDKPHEALKLLDQAVRVNPFDPAIFTLDLAISQFLKLEKRSKQNKTILEILKTA